MIKTTVVVTVPAKTISFSEMLEFKMYIIYGGEYQGLTVIRIGDTVYALDAKFTKNNSWLTADDLSVKEAPIGHKVVLEQLL